MALDPGTADDPLHLIDGVRSYAGVPLRTSSGHVIGAVCVLDGHDRVVRNRRSETHVHDFQWLTGPQLHGFTSGGAPLTTGGVEESIRNFLAEVDPGRATWTSCGRPSRAC
ncbi:hypothetical protein NUM3379_06580 [Kineococcus sp. NUM-3379]